MYSAEVSIDGPLFDGRYEIAVARFIEDAKREVGQQALADVQQILDQRIQHPTPYYETQITMQSLGDSVVVHDRDIIYGPWLEGTGERNRTTKFKGYAAFRSATQLIERQIDSLLRHVLSRHIGNMR